MKKIINGKVYSTDTAKRVAIYYSGYDPNDFHYYTEELYQKKTGEFFLFGYGKAASPYSERFGSNEWCGGSKIIPLSFKDAQEWAEKHLDGEDYCEIFGEPDEDDENVLLGVRVSAASAHKLKKLSMKDNVSQNKIIEYLINSWYDDLMGRDDPYLPPRYYEDVKVRDQYFEKLFEEYHEKLDLDEEWFNE